MGLLDKFKNLFTEEVEEEVVEVKKEIVKPKEPIKQEIPAPTVKPIIKNEEDPIKTENLSLKKEEKFVFPVYFDDKDFDDISKKEETKPKRVETPLRRETKQESSYKEAYNNKKSEVKEEKRVFKPTPIISPVYGILDKNYYKEDIVVSPISRTTYHDNKPMSVDDVRKKAFGTLEDDLEKTLFSDNLTESAPKHGKIEDDDSIFNEFDFANAVEEDKKRDLSKDGLKADIEALLDNKEFAREIDYHSEKVEEIENELDNIEIEEDVISIPEKEINYSDEVEINEEETNDDLNEDIELPDNISSDDEIEKAYADSSDLNDSDLFNLIDSMYEKEDN